MSENKVLIVAHGDFDGVISAVGVAELFGITPKEIRVIFTQPFLVDKVKIPDDIEEVYVVDIAVNNRDPEMTTKFIESIGARLETWYDHHAGWSRRGGAFAIDENFSACAEWFRQEGKYPGLGPLMVVDAIAADTRKGRLSPNSLLIEQATKANMADDSIRVAAVKWLLGDESQQAILEAAAEKYVAIQKETERLSATYEVSGKVAIVDARGSHGHDLTQLLLAGQKLAEFAVAKVIDPRSKEERITVATQSGKNLVELFGLPSGAPFRVSVEAARLPEVLEKLNADQNSRPCNCGSGAKVMESHERTPFCG